MDVERIPKEKYENELHLPLKDFGSCFLPITFQRYYEDIKNMEVRDDDVWITSYPKSGTTWSQEMIWLIGNDLDYKGAQRNLIERFPFVELFSMLDWKTYVTKHPEFVVPDDLLDPIPVIDKLPSPRYIKTHLPWNLLPLQIQNGTRKPKIIHVIRNPKDVLLSYFHHSTLLHGFTTNLEEFFYLFMNDKVAYNPYFSNILSFWNMKHLDNLLITTYEDMQKDLKSVVNIVAKFLNKQISDEDMPKLLKHLSFEEMKNNEAVNFDPWVEIIKKSNAINVADKKFFRSGKSGEHKQCLTKEMISTLDKWIEANCKNTTLKFD